MSQAFPWRGVDARGRGFPTWILDYCSHEQPHENEEQALDEWLQMHGRHWPKTSSISPRLTQQRPLDRKPVIKAAGELTVERSSSAVRVRLILVASTPPLQGNSPPEEMVVVQMTSASCQCVHQILSTVMLRGQPTPKKPPPKATRTCIRKCCS